MTSTASTASGDCSNCRYVATNTRPKIMEETGFDDQLMFDDIDEAIYTCRAFADQIALCEHAGKEIGLVPITCSTWAVPAQKSKNAEADRLIAMFEERMKKKEVAER